MLLEVNILRGRGLYIGRATYGYCLARVNTWIEEIAYHERYMGLGHTKILARLRWNVASLRRREC